MTERQQRRLAAILAADIAGYSTLMGADEEATVLDLKAHQAVVLPMIAQFRGRIIDTAGDGILAEFTSVVNAVECAVTIQETMANRNAHVEVERRMQYRMGINLGDVMYDDIRIYGDGINVAARLEGIAEPGGICISSKVYEDIRGKIHLAYDDIGEQRLKNISHPIQVYRIRIPTASGKPAAMVAFPDKPSIAVLPFQNLSGDPEQEYFADGMVEEIITALSRIRWLFVVARNSSFQYKGKSPDVRQVGRELGVRYVLEGSVRRAGGRLRISGQLIDATTGAHLWADRFDGSLNEVFELQDNVASSVAGVIEPTLQVAEFRRAAQRPTNDLTAYDLYLRAFADGASMVKERLLGALDLLKEALDRDPNYGSALALAPICYTNVYFNGWSDDLEAVRAEGVGLARRALHASDDDPVVLANAAYTLASFGEDINAMIALMDRALELNPSFARGWMRSGWLRLWAGEPDLAIEHFKTFLRLSPRENRANANLSIGVGHFFARRLDQAQRMLLLSLQEVPNWPPTYRFLASCYAHMGRLDDAYDVIRRLHKLTPLVIAPAEHWRRSEQREFYLEGLHKALGSDPA